MTNRYDMFNKLINSYTNRGDFFFTWPESPKPPIDEQFIVDQNDKRKLKQWQVQYALAGFTDQDVKVWCEENELFVQGDNTHVSNVLDKFKCKFTHNYKVSKHMDLDNVSVSLSCGILFITIPVKEVKKKRKMLFGN